MKSRSLLKRTTRFCLLLTTVLLVACGQEQAGENTAENARNSSDYTYAPLAPVLELEPQVEEAIQNWESFWDLQQEMELFRAKGSGDLSFITDDLLRIQTELINDSIPEKVQNPAVKSRSLVFGTFARKLKDQISHRAPVAELDTTRFKLMEAYNAFRFHISDALRDKVYEDFLERDTTYLDSLLQN